MKRVLFVDDERNVLDGLKRMMRPLRHEWDMRFVDSGEAALSTLSETPAEVLVTDMRMPAMAGIELLTQVRERWPGTVRIALSGHSETEMLLRSTRVAHQFLATPCDAEELKLAVERSAAMRALLDDTRLEQLAAHLDALPSLPDLYVQLCDLLASEDASINEVGAIIERDVAMSAKILQVVNSAFFGLRRHVSSPAEAASMLGTEIIQGMVLTAGVFSAFDAEVAGFSQQALWQHSLASGAAARAIARSEGLATRVQDLTFQAALLHDVGKLMLAANLPEDYARALEIAGAAGADLVAAERQVFGHSHAEIGAYLIGIWGLPDPVVEAVAFHHRPSDAPGAGTSPLAIVHVANLLAHHGDGGEAPEPDTDFLTERGLAEASGRWAEAARSALEAA